VASLAPTFTCSTTRAWFKNGMDCLQLPVSSIK
jgi:hypothetical protein